jgi:hypothetical protein
MGMLNASSIKSFSGNCRGKVLEKFQIFFRQPLHYAGFDSEGCGRPAAVVSSFPTTGSRSAPQSRHRVVLGNCQLSGGQIDARDAKRDGIILPTTSRKRSSYLRRNGSHSRRRSRFQKSKLVSIADYEYALAVCAHFCSPAVYFDRP